MPKKLTLRGAPAVIHGDPSDAAYAGIRSWLYKDPIFSDTLAPYIPPDATILDVGANLGITAVILARIAPQGQVYAFEPTPRTCDHLARNIEANRLENVHLVRLALTDRPGPLRFMDNRSGSGWNFSVPDGADQLDPVLVGARPIEVPGDTMDHWVEAAGLSRVDFIKIDVEGGELRVLEGAARTLERFHPLVMLEFNAWTLLMFQRVFPQDALKVLRDRFPYLYRFDRVYYDLVPIATPLEAYLFVHDNMAKHSCVDDLVASYSPLDLSRQRLSSWTRWARRGMETLRLGKRWLRMVRGME